MLKEYNSIRAEELELMWKDSEGKPIVKVGMVNPDTEEGLERRLKKHQNSIFLGLLGLRKAWKVNAGFDVSAVEMQILNLLQQLNLQVDLTKLRGSVTSELFYNGEYVEDVIKFNFGDCLTEVDYSEYRDWCLPIEEVSEYSPVSGVPNI